jgi:hypothetical protein
MKGLNNEEPLQKYSCEKSRKISREDISAERKDWDERPKVKDAMHSPKTQKLRARITLPLLRDMKL